MSNKKEKAARQAAEKRQATIDAQRAAARRAKISEDRVFEGDCALDVYASGLVTGVKINAEYGSTGKPNEPAKPYSKLIEIAKWSVFSFGVGAACNFFGPDPRILWATFAGFWAAIGIYTCVHFRNILTLVVLIVLCIASWLPTHRWIKSKLGEIAVAEAARRFEDKTLTAVSNELFTMKASAESNNLFGVLLPANEPSPQIGDNGNPPTNAMVLYIGNAATLVVWFPHTVIEYKGKQVLTVSTNSEGLTISGEFFGDNGNVVCVLESNRFIINPSNFLVRERPDKSTLIVRDQKNIVVLDVRFLNPHAIRLNGRFRFPDRPDLVISPNEGFFKNKVFTGANMVDYLVR